MITAVIIDDVEHAIVTLKKDLEDYCPQVEIIGTADGVVNGAKLIKQLNPKVVFLDIQMQDGSGFDLLEILGDIDFELIFTTASDSFAIKAFKYSALDYLLKPIDPDELVEALKKVEAGSGDKTDSIQLLKDSIRGKNIPNRIALNMMERIRITEIDQIIRCEASVNYTMFFLKDGQKLIVTKPLKEYESILADHDFLRVHQSHLINTRWIKEYMKLDGGYIVMTDESQVPVSVRKKKQVMELLKSL